MDKKLDLREALKWINCAALHYQDWVNVGMALKAEGYSVSDWDAWSASDPGRYHSGECQRHWDTFRGSDNPVTGGTIVKMAMDAGWRPSGGGDDYEIDWNDAIGSRKDKLKVVDESWMEEKDIPAPPETMDGAKELIRYLKLLFDGSENVGYVTHSYINEDGKHVPTKGNYDRTADQLIEALSKCNGDVGAVLGDYDPEAGAWIRFNPLDGKGVKNENVTEYRFALVESDTLEIGRQYSLMLELQLPIAVMVHSGKKSIHAIVHIDAKDYTEYRKRVDYLYSVCEKNGMQLDKQNRNPSRLSRMPGVMRNGKPQYIITENIGCKDFEAWQEYIEGINDDLPDPVNLKAEVQAGLPDLAPELISGILRHGHKMLLSGPSKAGKSYALIELCISIAEGIPWMGLQCDIGKVFYINLEIDKASCLHRFDDVYKALGIEPKHQDNIEIWNLRGKSCPMDKLTPKLIRRAQKMKFDVIVIDPIYKVITGDENAADQMSAFCNQFDRLCTELNCAVIYCHHHSKGSQGQKRSMDRASGSGVFARDPDALVDMIELPIPGETRDVMIQNMKCAKYGEYLDMWNDPWRDDMSELEQISFVSMEARCRKVGNDQARSWMMREVEKAEEALRYMTGWRLEGTLREFKPMSPRYVLFQHPVHREDTKGILKGLKAEGEKKGKAGKAQEARKLSAEEKREQEKADFDDAVANANGGEPPTVKHLVEWFTKDEDDPPKEDTLRRKLKKYGYKIDKNTGFITPNAARDGL